MAEIHTDNDGVQTEVQHFSKTHSSSDNYQGEGVEVRTADRGRVNVSDPSTLQPNDIVNVDGMELTVQQAREYGVLDSLFSGEAPKMASPNQAAQQEAEAQGRPKPAEGTLGDHNDLAATLSEQVESGNLSADEAQAYDLVGANLEMAGMNYQSAVDLHYGLEEGTVNSNDVDPQQIQLVQDQANRVRAAATTSIISEIGAEGFNELEAMAAAAPGVKDVLERFAVDRATGQTEDITWGDLLEHLRAELR